MVDPRSLTLGEAVARLREGRLRARALAETALDRSRLGAYRSVDRALTLGLADRADAAFEAGRRLGPLQGVPVSVKDLFGVPGLPTFAGTARRLPPRFEQAGPVVAGLLAGLAVVTGKTHMVELAFGGLGTNPHHPTPPNPWDAAAHRVPGGSSAGAGVSLAEGSAMLALGTDTAGSVRIPAAWTGAAGLKTTVGRWPTGGLVPLSPTLDTVGLLARSVEDLALGFAALDPVAAGPPEPAAIAGVRLARCETLLFEGCSPGVVEAVDRALDELGRAGARVGGLELPEALEADALLRCGGPVAVELDAFLEAELPEWVEGLDPNIRARLGDASTLPARVYLERLALMGRLHRSASERLLGFDALVGPTVPITPPKLDEVATGTGYARRNLLALRNTAVASYLGLCAVTVPVGLDAAGLPVGLQLTGEAGGEERLLAVALACERVLGRPSDRLGRPPRCAP